MDNNTAPTEKKSHPSDGFLLLLRLINNTMSSPPICQDPGDCIPVSRTNRASFPATASVPG